MDNLYKLLNMGNFNGVRVIKVNLRGDYSEAILEALRVLQQGGSIVYPTDTIYGLGANGCDFKAAEQIFKIKQRPWSKPLPLIARNLGWIRSLAFVPPKMEKLLAQLWPGPVTVVLGKRSIIPAIVTANDHTVALRIPDLPLIDKLLAKFGYPLTATSANLSGEEGSGDIKTVLRAFEGKLWKPDLALDAGCLPKSTPSTILDLSTIQPKILRVGPTKPEILMRLLGATYAKKPHPKRNSASV